VVGLAKADPTVQQKIPDLKQTIEKVWDEATKDACRDPGKRKAAVSYAREVRFAEADGRPIGRARSQDMDSLHLSKVVEGNLAWP